MTRARQKALRDPRVLIIDDLELDEELDVGGEIGEVSQNISDRAVCGDGSTEVETVPLPSGKHGWKRNSHLRLPVGFLPPEWRGRRVRVTFEVEPRRRAAQKHGPKERAAAVARVVETGKTQPIARELRVSENTLVKWCIAAGCWPPSPPSKSPTPLGQKVQDLRRERQLTQADLAHIAGLSAATVTNIERSAERGPHIATIHGLARALGVPPDELSNLRRRTKKGGTAR